MASKSSQPALYEMIYNRTGSMARPADTASSHRHVAPATANVAPLGGGGGGAGWLKPGTSVRLPSGYIMLACGLGIILLTMTYLIGHRRGHTLARTEMEQIIAGTIPATDPLTSGQPNGDAAGGAPAGGAFNASIAGGTVTTGGSPSQWGSVIPTRDPRQKGVNYFVLMEAPENGARQLAEFCRTNGLETYVVGGKNERSRRVVAFPGFEAAALNSPERKALEARIHEIGEKWKKTRASGGFDLGGAYPALYNG